MKVWAPGKTTVDLVLTDRTVAMTPEPGGWWSADVDLHHGDDYAFSLDGGPPLPDPRTPWQPAGKHGPSRIFDTSRFTWTDHDWPGRDARGAVTYELHVGAFTEAGTLDSAIERLDYLADLGVQMVELMPILPSPGEHGWGYDGVGPYCVWEVYGGPAALQRFVDAAHGRGLGVCLDVVYNHWGPTGNYIGSFGPYLRTESTVWGTGPNLDGPDSGPVRSWIIGAALRWFTDFHVDALRLDATHAIVDASDAHLLAELSDRTTALSAELGRPLSLVAEDDRNDPATVAPTAEGGLGMRGQWADDVHHAIHALLTGERQGYYVDFGSLPVLAKALRGAFVHDGTFSTFRDRFWGAPIPPDTPADAFVVFTANHDQIGNRAIGDRPSQTLNPDQLAIAAALVLLTGFTPLIFMGEEWGATTPFPFFTDHSDPAIGAATSAGRAAEFLRHGWTEPTPDPEDPATFASAKLDWTELTEAPHAGLLSWYRRLIRLRNLLPPGDPLGGLDVTYGPDWLTTRRGPVVVVIAFGPTTVRVPDGQVADTWRPVDATPDGLVFTGPGAAILTTELR